VVGGGLKSSPVARNALTLSYRESSECTDSLVRLFKRRRERSFYEESSCEGKCDMVVLILRWFMRAGDVAILCARAIQSQLVWPLFSASATWESLCFSVTCAKSGTVWYKRYNCSGKLEMFKTI